MKTIKSDEVPITVSPRGPKVKHVVSTEHIAVTEIMLEPGQILPPHRTPVDVVFYVKSGSGYVAVGDEKELVSEGTFVESPKNIPHGLQAAESSGFDVLVLKTPNPGWKAKE